MKKYITLNRYVLEKVKDAALNSYKNKSLDNREIDTFITECYSTSLLDELVRQGVLSFEHDAENKVRYYIKEN